MSAQGVRHERLRKLAHVPPRRPRVRFGTLAAVVFAALVAVLLGERLEGAVADRVQAVFAPPPAQRIAVLQLSAADAADPATLAALVADLDAAGAAAVGLALPLDRRDFADPVLAAAVEAARVPLVVAATAGELPPAALRSGSLALSPDPGDGVVRHLPAAAAPPPFPLALSGAVGGPAVMPTGRIVWADAAFARAPAGKLLWRGRMRGRIVLVGTEAILERVQEKWSRFSARSARKQESWSRFGERTFTEHAPAAPRAVPGAAASLAVPHTVPGADGRAPPVLVAAHILSQILAGTTRAAQPAWAVPASAAAAALLALGLARWPPGPTLAVGLLCAAGIAGTALAVAAATPALPPVLTPAAAFALAAAALALRRACEMRRERTARAARAFRALPDAVAGRFAPEALAPERREVTLLLVRLDGAPLDRVAAHAAEAAAGAALDAAAERVLGAGGAILFAGQTLLAVFGAPEPRPDHAARAVACAEAIAAGAAGAGARVRCAAHTGTALVGAIGSGPAAGYAAVGAAVAVVEALAADGDDAVVLSEATRRRAGIAAPPPPNPFATPPARWERPLPMSATANAGGPY